MLFVDNQNNTDPRVNLAIEEHLLRNARVNEPILLFYVNEPSAIIGRNQNTLEEIDPDYVEANNIHVVRRLSGGGAVYHDFGNLNFSFITNGKEDLHNFAKFTDPVIRVLNELGVPAQLQGRSDIFVAGKKVSGNAQYLTRNRMFSHGTLLFDSNLEELLKAINPRQVVIESQAVQSIRSFVTNIRDHLPEPMDIQQLKEAILRGVFGGGEIPAYELSDKDWVQIERYRIERYDNWDWNIGRSPKFTVQKSGRFPSGKVDARIDVEKGRIQGVKIFGDFMGRREAAELEAQLVGLRYERGVLATAVQPIDIAAYLGDLQQSEFLDLLY
ncbi:MAG: lipoate--protein ligase [Chloroflexi bacterium]|nr:lipoate--protein ligase [Chloroflexota bacterium]